ncbi:MAG: hypothetical protein ABF624_07340 [Liquorilactobacillus ghanensis]|uniref:hypothetical protein n=1 Tax=Liquorilactobacillus ghanensis TaxID=399370 RepID=UPI0039E9DE9E
MTNQSFPYTRSDYDLIKNSTTPSTSLLRKEKGQSQFQYSPKLIFLYMLSRHGQLFFNDQRLKIKPQQLIMIFPQQFFKIATSFQSPIQYYQFQFSVNELVLTNQQEKVFCQAALKNRQLPPNVQLSVVEQQQLQTLIDLTASAYQITMLPFLLHLCWPDTKKVTVNNYF